MPPEELVGERRQAERGAAVSQSERRRPRPAVVDHGANVREERVVRHVADHMHVIRLRALAEPRPSALEDQAHSGFACRRGNLPGARSSVRQRRRAEPEKHRRVTPFQELLRLRDELATKSAVILAAISAAMSASAARRGPPEPRPRSCWRADPPLEATSGRDGRG